MLQEIKNLCSGLSVEEINDLIKYLNSKKQVKIKRNELTKSLFKFI